MHNLLYELFRCYFGRLSNSAEIFWLSTSSASLVIYLFILLGFQLHWQFQGHMATSSFYWWRKTPGIHISEYSHVWIEPPNHHRSAGKPPRMKVFVLTGTLTHAVRGWVVGNHGSQPFDQRHPWNFGENRLKTVWVREQTLSRCCCFRYIHNNASFKRHIKSM